jgi:hypothetical protein
MLSRTAEAPGVLPTPRGPAKSLIRSSGGSRVAGRRRLWRRLAVPCRDTYHPRPQPTTPHSRQAAGGRPVAGLVVDATNARVAVELFTGQRTFEAHLFWAYRKLVVLPASGPNCAGCWYRLPVRRRSPGTAFAETCGFHGFVRAPFACTVHTVDLPGEHPVSRAFPG